MRQPEPFIHGGLSEVIGIVATQHALQSEGMSQRKDRCIQVDGESSLLGIDEGLARSKAHHRHQLRGTDLPVVQGKGIIGSNARVHHPPLVHGDECQSATRFVLLSLHRYGGLESELLLPFESQLLTVVEHHLVHLRPLECREHVILIRMYELVGRTSHIIGTGKRYRTLGEFSGQVVFLVE